MYDHTFINKIATLAKIHLSEKESTSLQSDFEKIMSMIQSIQKVDTSEVDNLSSTLSSQPLRPDIAFPVNREELQISSQNIEDNAYSVPKVIDN